MILITGSSGFIGRFLVDTLLEKDYQVTILVNKLPPPKKWLDNRRVKILNVNITKREDFLAIPANLKFEAAIHLAAYIPRNNDNAVLEKSLDTNCLGTENLIQFCLDRQVGKLVYSSSITVYKQPEVQIVKTKEDYLTYPDTFYGMSKLLGEMLCSRTANISKIPTVTLRFSYVYGPGQRTDTVIPIFANNAHASHDITVFGSGGKIRDYIYIKDAVQTIIRTLEKNVTGVFNIGSGQGTSMVELAKKIVTVFQSNSKIILDTEKKEEPSGIIMDISKAEKELEYRVVYPLEKGLADYRYSLEGKN
jgi:nucleoside-diphosphate-sugar epimerase